MKTKKQHILKWFLYILFLIVLYTIQTTPGFFSIKGIQPILIVPFALSVSIFEGELAGCVIGMLTGFLWDVSAGRLLGYSAILIMICCVGAALLFMYLLQANVINGIWVCAASLAAYFLIDFIVVYALWSYAGLLYILKNMAFMLIYSTVLMIPIFLFIKWMHQKLTPNPDEN